MISNASSTTKPRVPEQLPANIKRRSVSTAPSGSRDLRGR
jgi:hypothetical protein